MKWHVRCGNVMRQLVCLAGCIFLCIGIAGATDQTTAAAQQQADSQSGVLVGSLTQTRQQPAKSLPHLHFYSIQFHVTSSFGMPHSDTIMRSIVSRSVCSVPCAVRVKPVSTVRPSVS